VGQIAQTFGVDWAHLLAQVVSFSIVCALLYRLAYTPVLAMLATRSELIASNHTTEEIRRFVEADSLGYLSIGSLRKAVADDEKHEFCYACYTGDYPTELVNIEELIAARQKRK